MAFKQKKWSPYTKMSKPMTTRDKKRLLKMEDSMHGSGASKYWGDRAKDFAAAQNYAASVTPWIKKGQKPATPKHDKKFAAKRAKQFSAAQNYAASVTPWI